ncbi:MAG: hypothetical protein ACSHYF_18375 [Verrucomicrobiaceae bacterium]
MKTILALFLSSLLLSAQEIPDRQALIENLFEQREPQAFAKALIEATKGGVPPQALLEARFVFTVDTGDRSALAALAPVLKEQVKRFSIDDSVIFSVPEDFLAVVEYTAAIAALESSDQVAFKKHILEAFWLSPAQAPEFGKLIDEVRLNNAMAALKIDLTRRLAIQTSDAQSKPLIEIFGDSQIAVLHFWSPWARESSESMDDFFLTAKELEKNKIPTASILLSGSPDSLADANTFVKENKGKTNALWLVDSPVKSLGSIFRIQAFPTVVLLTKEGKVHFNGHPADPTFWSKLKAIVPAVRRPDAPLEVRDPLSEGP